MSKLHSLSGAGTQRPGAMTFLLDFQKFIEVFLPSKNKHSIRRRRSRSVGEIVNAAKMKFENHEMLICSNVRNPRRERRRQKFGFHFYHRKIFLRHSNSFLSIFLERKHRKKNVESENNTRFFRCVIIHNTMDGQSQMIYNCT